MCVSHPLPTPVWGDVSLCPKYNGVFPSFRTRAPWEGYACVGVGEGGGGRKREHPVPGVLAGTHTPTMPHVHRPREVGVGSAHMRGV